MKFLFIVVGLTICGRCFVLGEESNANPNAIRKVIKLLETLDADLTKELDEAKKEHEEYTFWAEKLIKDLQEENENDAGSQREYEANVGEEMSNIENDKSNLAELEHDQQTEKGNRDQQTADRDHDVQECEHRVKNLTEALNAVKAAKVELKNTHSGQSLLQETASRVLSSGYSNDFVLSLLTRPVSNYDNHSEGIIGLLEKLEAEIENDRHIEKSDCTRNRKGHDAKIEKFSSAYEDLTQHQIPEKEKELQNHTVALRVAETNLADVTKKLDENREKLEVTQREFANHKTEYAQQKSTREKEKEAIVSTLDQLPDADAQKGGGGDEAYSAHENSEISYCVEDNKLAINECESSGGSGGGSEVKFVQVRKLLFPNASRNRVAKELAENGENLHSFVLTSVAAQMQAGSPFKKVISLIRQMIAKMQKEEASDSEAHEECNNRKAEQEQKLTQATEKVNDNNSESARLEAVVAEKIEQISDLQNSMTKMTSDFDERQGQRLTECKNSQQVETTNLNAADAGKAAFALLQKFYTDNADNAHDEEQYSGKNEAYKGNQDRATGILGMIQVIIDDAVNTVSETRETDQQEHDAFNEFYRATNRSHVDHCSRKNNASIQKTDALSDRVDAYQKLEDNQSLLENAYEELDSIWKECDETAKTMSYEERVQKREKEIQALRQALCQLDKSGPVQTGEC